MIQLIFHFQLEHIFVKLKIDQDTGETKVVKYTAVDDFGTIINPNDR